MKILQLLPALHQGGAERGAVELSRELIRRGIESAVISQGGRLAAQIESDGGKHYVLSVKSKNPLTFFPRALQLRGAIKSIRPDIIHVRSRLPAWLLKFANASLKLPVVSTVHGFNRVGRYSRVMTDADKIICASPSIKNYVRANYGIADEKIALIPRGVDLAAFNPNHLDDKFIREFRAKYQLENAYIAAAVGRIAPGKGLATFIRALARAQKKRKILIGLIIGDADQSRLAHLGKLKNLADELNAPIKFIGNQSRMTEIYSLADVIVSCAEKPETFGRTLAESLAMNCPVIATRHGGAMDIVRENKDGFLFAPGDDADLAELLIAAGECEWKGLRESASRFSLDEMAEKTLAVYQSVLAESRRQK